MPVRSRLASPRCRRCAAGAAATVLAAVLAAACSPSPSAPQVASLGGPHPAAANPAAGFTQAQSEQDMISFTRCMRAHGVPIPDPVHQPGHAGLSVAIPPHSNATRSGWDACGHFLVRIIQIKSAAAAAQVAPHLAALTNYARCMRAHNINMLDPTPQGELNLGHVPGVSSDFGRYSPQFGAADAACRHLLPAGVGDNGTGP